MTSVDSQLNACVAAFTPPVHAIPLTRERSRFSSETGAAISGRRTSSRAGSWVVTWRGRAEGLKETASSPRTPSQPARQRFVRVEGASARAQQAQPAADQSRGTPPRAARRLRSGRSASADCYRRAEIYTRARRSGGSVCGCLWGSECGRRRARRDTRVPPSRAR